MSTQNPEDLLRATLAAKADDAATTLTVDDIRRGAATSRRRGRRRAAVVLVAAAVLAAVAVPTALLLRSGEPEGQPAPAPTAPTTTPTTTLGGSIRGLPRSAAPDVTYRQEGTIHLASGGTTALPGDVRNISAFAAYHGGWLVADDDTGTVRWYDNTGALKADGDGLGLFAASADGTRLAYPMGGKIHIGIASGMGEGEQTVPVAHSRDVWPVGFLSAGALVYNDVGGVRTSEPARAFPAAMARARAVSVDDVVAGEDQDGRGMAWSARTGKTLWEHSDYTVWAFSADGRYAAATKSPTGGDFSEVAILEASTGHVVAAASLLDDNGGGIVMDRTPVFDSNGDLLFIGLDNTGEHAILRLTPDGVESRTTDPVLPTPGVAGYSPLLFATGP